MYKYIAPRDEGNCSKVEYSSVEAEDDDNRILRRHFSVGPIEDFKTARNKFCDSGVMIRRILIYSHI